ncbi:MAG: hypothetical protein ABIM21_03015, partial [candidate division WOR-3 bacterium]
CVIPYFAVFLFCPFAPKENLRPHAPLPLRSSARFGVSLTLNHYINSALVYKRLLCLQFFIVILSKSISLYDINPKNYRILFQQYQWEIHAP